VIEIERNRRSSIKVKGGIKASASPFRKIVYSQEQADVKTTVKK
jgi:hypothetical protein